MIKRAVVGGILAMTLAVVIAVAGPAIGQNYYGGYGPGMMGPGMMGPGMMGPGMMGPGMMGPGMMGYGMMGGCNPNMMGWGYGPQQPQQTNLNLSTNDVKAYLDRYVATLGNPHLKSGPVTEKDSNTITADIVTTDKEALAQRFNVDRHTGYWQPVQ